MKTVGEIVALHIRVCGGDGLALVEEECGCTLDNLALCDRWSPDCVPARDVGPRNGYDFWMVPMHMHMDDDESEKAG